MKLIFLFAPLVLSGFSPRPRQQRRASRLPRSIQRSENVRGNTCKSIFFLYCSVSFVYFGAHFDKKRMFNFGLGFVYSMFHPEIKFVEFIFYQRFIFIVEIEAKIRKQLTLTTKP